MRAAILQTPAASELLHSADTAARELDGLAVSVIGDPDRDRLSESSTPSIKNLVDRVTWMIADTTAGPTHTQREAIDRAEAALTAAGSRRDDVLTEIDSITERRSSAADSRGSPSPSVECLPEAEVAGRVPSADIDTPNPPAT